MKRQKHSLSPSRRTLRRGILFTSIASLLAVQAGFAADAVLSSGAITGDADSGVSTAKTYVAIGNIIGGNVTINGATFIGSGGGLSGAGWTLNGAGAQFGSGGDHTGFVGQAISGLFDGFQYNGNPATLNFSGLTAGQTYVATLYNEAWGLGADRTQLVERISADFASFAGIEYVNIGKETTLYQLKNELRWSEVYYQVNR